MSHWQSKYRSLRKEMSRSGTVEPITTARLSVVGMASAKKQKQRQITAETSG